MTKVMTYYETFIIGESEQADEQKSAFLKVELGKREFSVGREVILGRFLSNDDTRKKLGILEFFRFDENCNRRLDFSQEILTLASGLRIDVILRTSSYQGLLRFLEEHPEITDGEGEFVHIPIDSDENFEKGLCADKQRLLVNAALTRNDNLLACVHCERPVSSDGSPVVEIDVESSVVVGLTHSECRLPHDRIIGIARSEFHRAHPKLVNFDANAWFAAIHGGQGVFAASSRIGTEGLQILWDGPRSVSSAVLGSHVVECLLVGGEREFCTLRTAIHRFSHKEAEDFARSLSVSAEIASKKGDPLCYSDQSKAFGERSFLLSKLGMSERLRVVESARARKYDARFAKRYNFFENWYAPLLYLRDRNTMTPFSLFDHVVLITDPLVLERHMENWQQAGMAIPTYETATILDDRSFDEFMMMFRENDVRIIADPIFNGERMQGIPILRIDQIEDDRDFVTAF